MLVCLWPVGVAQRGGPDGVIFAGCESGRFWGTDVVHGPAGDTDRFQIGPGHGGRHD